MREVVNAEITPDLALPQTLVELLEQRAVSPLPCDGYTFLKGGDIETGSLNFHQLDARARAIATVLQSCTRPGARALLLYPQGLDFIEAFFGCLYAGVIAVPAYPPKRNQKNLRLQAIIDDTDAAVVLTVSRLADECTRAFASRRHVTRIIATDHIATHHATKAAPISIGPDTLAFLQYTSGSTGSPKGVMVTHRNLLANLEAQAAAYRPTSTSTMVTWLPAFHDLGLIYGLLLPLYGGFRCYLMEPAAFYQRPARWLEAIAKYGGTHAGGPSSAYEHCLREVTDAERAGLDLSSWKSALNGAEPVQAETLERFSARFADNGFSAAAFSPAYGLAEATLVVSCVHGGEQMQTYEVAADVRRGNNYVVPATSTAMGSRLVGCGRLIDDFEARIVDPDTLNECAPGHIGELWIKGSSVAQGYWQKPNATEETFRARIGTSETDGDNYLRTGDLAALVGDQLVIAGRRKDMMILRGRNFYPQDIEWAASQVDPALRGGIGAAFAVDETGDARIILVHEVGRVHRHNIDVDRVSRSICRATLAYADAPIDEVVFVMPGQVLRTSSGKIQRSACRQALADNTLAVVGRWRAHGKVPGDSGTVIPGSRASEDAPRTLSLEDAIRDVILKEVASSCNLPDDQVHSFDPLIRYEIDSLAIHLIAMQLEEMLGISVPAEQLLRFPSIDAISIHLTGQLARNDVELLEF
jgi:acyl-CoA synthetase (AMP-forming)/AMP-acid ligase II/acyl carrier protein